MSNKEKSVKVQMELKTKMIFPIKPNESLFFFGAKTLLEKRMDKMGLAYVETMERSDDGTGRNGRWVENPSELLFGSIMFDGLSVCCSEDDSRKVFSHDDGVESLESDVRLFGVVIVWFIGLISTAGIIQFFCTASQHWREFGCEGIN